MPVEGVTPSEGLGEGWAPAAKADQIVMAAAVAMRLCRRTCLMAFETSPHSHLVEIGRLLLSCDRKKFVG